MILKIIKKLVFAILIIYGLDILIQNIGIFVPLNLVTISVVSLLGFPGLISLALSFFFLI